MSGAASSNSWLKHPGTRPGTRLRLFCLPHAGGGASMFSRWASGMPGDVQVCPVQLPGRENRLVDPPFVRLDPLIDALAQALAPHLDLPYAIFGHSLGALIGFEAARALARRSLPGPARLYVSAHRAPHLPSREQPIHRLPDAEFLSQLKRYHGTPDEFLEHAELKHLLLPTLRADFAVGETYRYRGGTVLTCPVVAFGGMADPEVNRDELEAWRQHTRGAFGLHMLPGDHFFAQATSTPLLVILAQDLAHVF